MVRATFNPVYTSQSGTQMRIRLNLRSILGSKQFDSNEILCIKLADVQAVNESGSTLVDDTSPGWIRTSNIIISGPNFVGGANELILGQATNFNPNEEFQLALEYHRANLDPGNIYLRYLTVLNSDTQNGNYEGAEFALSYLQPINNNAIEKGNRNWRWNYREQPNYQQQATDTNPSLENKVFTITSSTLSGVNFNIIKISIPGENTNITRSGTNFPITLTSVPNTPTQWYMVKRDYTQANDYGYGIEAWFHKPKNDYIDVTLELRDLLMNQLQPVMTIPDGKVLPLFTFVFDIYGK